MFKAASMLEPELEVSNGTNLLDYESSAKRKLRPATYHYYAGGSFSESTLRRNLAVLRQLRVIPRVMRDVSSISTQVELWGTKREVPLGVAPTAAHGLAHPSAELGTAAGCRRAGVIFVQSTFSNLALEEVAGTACEGQASSRKWLQLYIMRQRSVTADMIGRAISCGYEAVVITVDVPVLGKRGKDLEMGYSLPSHLSWGNFKKYKGTLDNVQSQSEAAARDSRTGEGSATRRNRPVDASLDWDFLTWVRSVTGNSIRVVLKGIMGVPDALKAAQTGLVDAVWVSNHGGRQLDDVPSAIQVLPSVTQALKSYGVPVFVDGGIRNGMDIMKALALGADMVFVGRPALYGLAMDGAVGVQRLLQTMKRELRASMSLSGCAKVDHIKELQWLWCRPQL